MASVLAVCGVLYGAISATRAQAPPPQPLKAEGVELAVTTLDAVTGNPIAGARIELHRLPTATDSREWTYTATTDASGRSVIPNIVAERYSLGATLKGRMPGAAQILVLAPSARPKPVVLRLFKSATIEGVVEDPDRNPMARARVELLEERWTAGQRTLARLRTAPTTGPTGRFSFEDLVPGSYYLRARPDPSLVQQQLRESGSSPDPEARRIAFVNTLYPDSQFLETAKALVLTPESSSQEVRIQMQKVRHYVVRGQVDNLAAGVPGPGLIFIRTVMFDSRFPFIADEPYDEQMRTRIAPDGKFTYDIGLPPGQYWMGYTPGGQANRFGGMDFRVTSGDVDLRTELWDGFPFAGSIVYDDGTPAANLAGTLRTFWSNRSIRVDAFTTDLQGNFNRPLYSDGMFRVDFADSGVSVVKIERDSRSRSGPDFEVTRSGGPFVITVTRMGASISGSVTLHKSTQDSPRGIVTLSGDPANPLDVPLRKRMNPPNNFTFANLGPGRYQLCAWAEEGTEVNRVLGNPAYDSRLGTLCRSVEVKAGQPATVDLKQVSALELQ